VKQALSCIICGHASADCFVVICSSVVADSCSTMHALIALVLALVLPLLISVAFDFCPIDVTSLMHNEDTCCVLLDCRLIRSVLSPTLHSLVANIADCCSLCPSPLTVAWIHLLFVAASRILPCRCTLIMKTLV
jgi:hypothetical protein